MAAIVGVKRDPVGNVMILDQARLPKEEKWLSLSSAEDVSVPCTLTPDAAESSAYTRSWLRFACAPHPLGVRSVRVR